MGTRKVERETRAARPENLFKVPHARFVSVGPCGISRYPKASNASTGGNLHFITFSCCRRLPLLGSARAREAVVRAAKDAGRMPALQHHGASWELGSAAKSPEGGRVAHVPRDFAPEPISPGMIALGRPEAETGPSACASLSPSPTRLFQFGIERQCVSRSGVARR